MNIYEKRLMVYNQLVEFVKEMIKDKRKWLIYDIEHKRDGSPQRLWWLREKLKLSEKEFANSLGIKEEEYKKYEKIGESVPIDVIENVSKLYKISKEWLEAKVEFNKLNFR